ncbi:mevalonate kinase [Klebsormidium nitens]|uniref:mevalonate kinase n=1 Tax=Klebsormidium nitens TaxID=105231 RepID=A0A0U9HID5_KLENI|nr:mevalonate kinase [Klebsormidium nitens]|eukprot:GAQ80580.1 mevalonate kinase [Klebsormidium nitens]
MAVFSASAPGKVILFGEHAVVHGASCIAASIDLRTSVSVHLQDAGGQDASGPSDSGGSTDAVTLALPGMGLEWRWQLEELRPYWQSSDGPAPIQHVTEATEELTTRLRDLAKTAIAPDASSSLVAGAAAFLFLHINILGLRSSRTVLQSELPMGAGLGSSAAFCASLVGALLAAVSAPGFSELDPISTILSSQAAKLPMQGLEAAKTESRTRQAASVDRITEAGCLVCRDRPAQDSHHERGDLQSVSNGAHEEERVQDGSSQDPHRKTAPLKVPLEKPSQQAHPEPGKPDSAFHSETPAAGMTLGTRPVEQRASEGNDRLEGMELANAWAFQAERIIHGRPSGVDNTVSCFGGAICFKKGVITRLPPMVSLRMLLTNTNVGRDTKALVAGVGQRAARLQAVYEPLFAAIDEMSQAFLRASASPAGDPANLQTLVEELVDLNQAILRGIGVSHAKIEEIIAVTERRSLHSKLTGAGGGGCVLTLLRDTDETVLQELITELEGKGFTCFLVSVGGPGLQLRTV